MKLFTHIKRTISINSHSWLLGCLFMFAGTIAAQPGLRFMPAAACVGENVDFALVVSNFNSIEAFSLYIQFNPEELAFQQLTADATLNGNGTLMYNYQTAPQHQLNISWVAGQSLNLNNQTLLHLSFVALSKQGSLHFLESCELVNADLLVIEQVNYTDGVLTDWTDLLPSPADTSVSASEGFSLKLPEIAGMSYHWQQLLHGSWQLLQNDSQHSGVNTANLCGQSLSLGELNYRAQLQLGSCAAFSHQAKVVATPLGYETLHNANSGIRIYPNPGSGRLFLAFDHYYETLSIRVVNISGQLIYQTKLLNVYAGTSREIPIDTLKGKNMAIVFIYEGGELLFSSRLIRN